MIAINNSETKNLAKPKPLRIAMFTSSYAPFLDGISLGVHDRVRWLLKQGHEVFLIHPEINDQYPSVVRKNNMPGLSELRSFPRFSSYAYPTKPLIFYKYAAEPLHYRHWSDTKLLENFQPDIVVVSEPSLMRGVCSLFLGGYGRPVGTEYAKQTGTPTISLFHTDWLAYIQYYFGNWSLKLFSPIISAFIKRFTEAYHVNYASSREQLAKYMAMKAQSCDYLPFLGVDCHKFHPRNICYDPIADDHRPTLLFVGRLAPEKNVMQLIDAFPIIAGSIPNVHLVIVGSGPQEEEVRRRAAKFGSGITIWGKSLGTEVLGWFARADVFVNPSITENFCRTNMEALASATPVVTAHAGGNAEQVVHGVNGFLTKPNSPIDFAEKVIAILKDPALKAKMTEQARPSVLKFDWSERLQEFENKLYELVEASKESEFIDDQCITNKQLRCTAIAQTYSAFHLREVHYPTRPIGHARLTKGRGVLHELAICCIYQRFK